MRMVLFTLVVLALVGVLIFDGVSMFGAHREAVEFAGQAGVQAALTFVDTDGDEDAVHRTIQDLASSNGIELVDLTFNKGTTRWYEVTVKAQSGSILLKHIPYFKDRLAQTSTSIKHF
jgi:hypothetical protein